MNALHVGATWRYKYFTSLYMNGYNPIRDMNQ